MPALFMGIGEGIPGRGGGVIHFPVKHVGLALPDLTLMDPEKWTASCVITKHIVAALRSQEEFRTADNIIFLREGIEEVGKV